MNLEEIKSAVEKLDPKEVYALSGWFAEYQEELWDKQIEDDAAAGRLDKLISEVDSEYKQGLTKPL